VKPPTPQSLGLPAPPRRAMPASVLNAHKLVGGATRVVMLKHRDNAPRPAVSFGGKSVSAVAMLVGGGLELPLPLYCVDARVENVTARAQSTRGSRKAGQDSDDELSAGDLDQPQDDEE
jgi:hypothetical protein